MFTLVDRLARAFAILGGIVLSVLIVMTCLSILGRSGNSILHSPMIQSAMPDLAAAILALGIGPIKGDFELVEAGMAFTIFAFLPLCQLNGAHAVVDLFSARLPMRTNRMLRALTEVVFAAVIVLIAWQLAEGMLAKRTAGQTTLYLEFPVWWAYACSLLAAVAAAGVSVYVATLRVIESVTGTAVLPPEPESEH
jgi:TRAP-type C4-dicarboxylate transport system permease small subunit